MACLDCDDCRKVLNWPSWTLAQVNYRYLFFSYTSYLILGKAIDENGDPLSSTPVDIHVKKGNGANVTIRITSGADGSIGFRGDIPMSTGNAYQFWNFINGHAGPIKIWATTAWDNATGIAGMPITLKDFSDAETTATCLMIQMEDFGYFQNDNEPNPLYQTAIPPNIYYLVYQP